MNVYVLHTTCDIHVSRSPRNVAAMCKRISAAELCFLPIEGAECYAVCISNSQESDIVQQFEQEQCTVQHVWQNETACSVLWTLSTGLPINTGIEKFVEGNIEHAVLRHVEAGACGLILQKLLHTGSTLAASLLSPAIRAKHPVSDAELFEAYVRMIFENMGQCDATVFSTEDEAYSHYSSFPLKSLDVRNVVAEDIPDSHISNAIIHADIVVFEGNSAPSFTKQELQGLLKRREKSPLLVCDFSPSNPLAVLRKLPHVYLFTNDNRRSLRARSLKERKTHIGNIQGAVSAATERFNTWLEGKQRTELCGMLGAHQEIQSIFDLIRRVSKNTITVLIGGESGTGKELAARAIHELGPRSERPFVVVNCGAIPENLIESELFGYVKGAFTGAAKDTDGLFRAAHSGTIFLDEVGELPLNLQVKLLRVLQEREVRPVGDSRSYPIDVRVVAATNKNLQEEVDQERFRSDLYYRLNVVDVILPALRHRSSDIPLLVRSFLKQAAMQFGLQTTPSITSKAMSILESHSWPGNIRQLRHTVERMVAVSETGIIDEHNIPDEIASVVPAQGGTTNDGAIENSGGKTLRDVERRHILKVLAEVDNNHEAAAKILGIGRTTLWRKLKEYGDTADT